MSCTFDLAHYAELLEAARAGGARPRVRRVGHHAVHPHVDLDGRFDRVLAWHDPDPPYVSAPVAGAVNIMAAPWFSSERERRLVQLAEDRIDLS